MWCALFFERKCEIWLLSFYNKEKKITIQAESGQKYIILALAPMFLLQLPHLVTFSIAQLIKLLHVLANSCLFMQPPDVEQH